MIRITFSVWIKKISDLNWQRIRVRKDSDFQVRPRTIATTVHKRIDKTTGCFVQNCLADVESGNAAGCCRIPYHGDRHRPYRRQKGCG